MGEMESYLKLRLTPNVYFHNIPNTMASKKMSYLHQSAHQNMHLDVPFDLWGWGGLKKNGPNLRLTDAP